MSILAKCETLDAAGAVKWFPTEDDFWVTLTKVYMEADRYLRDYTASVVLFDRETRDDFLKELEQTRSLLESLRVKRAPAMLDNLAEAVQRMDNGSLTDGLRVFYAEMDIIKNCMESALIPQDEVSVKQVGQPIVMAVDDMPEILNAIMEILAGRYRVIALDSGNAALKALASQTPDIFLLDIIMPGMSGYKLAEKIRKMDRFRKTPILFISSAESEEHFRAAKKIGGNDYLRKPLNGPLLLDRMREYLN
jgi:PleD family two-component response regulator